MGKYEELYDNIMESIASICYYNGYDCVLKKMREELLNGEFSAASYWNIKPNCTNDDGEIHFIAELLVILFGSYGTSPRGGWISKDDLFDDWKGALNFLDTIIKNIKKIEE